MSDNNNNTNIEQNGGDNNNNNTTNQDSIISTNPQVQQLPSFQLSPTELQQLQRLKEENKNPYIFAINKKLKAINKKLSKLQKLEQLQKSGKELNKTQLESLDRIKSHQKKINHFDDLKKNYIQIWDS